MQADILPYKRFKLVIITNDTLQMLVIRLVATLLVIFVIHFVVHFYTCTF